MAFPSDDSGGEVDSLVGTPMIRMKPFRILQLLLLSATLSRAAVTPTTLHRSRTATSVMITATGTSAFLDGAAFPLGVATPVTAVVSADGVWRPTTDGPFP